MNIELLSKENSYDLYIFEKDNKSYFEKTLPPRPNGYYNLQSFNKIINNLISEQNNKKHYMHIIRDENNICIGRINLFILENNLKTAELGYRIGKNQRNKGYATKAVEIVLKKAFTSYGLNKVIAGVGSYNIASKKVLLKNGFLFKKEIKNDICINDNLVDTLVFEKNK